MSHVVFFIIIMMPGDTHPLSFEYPVENYAACMYEAFRFEEKPSHQLLIRGGEMQIGCQITYNPSEEH